MIRKATIQDFKEYLKLKREEEKDLTAYLKTTIGYPENKTLKQEYSKILKDKKSFLLVIEDNKRLVGYLHATIFKNIYNKGGYVEDIFITKDFRRGGLASKLIDYFIDILKKEGYKKVQLSVNIKNKRAIKMYKKLGFMIYHYDLKKGWK